MTATRTAVRSKPNNHRALTTFRLSLSNNSVPTKTGGVITISRTENYCENSTFTTELEACLECALQYDIWQYYGESVAAAAEACGLDATPLAAANATTNGTATATGSTTSGSGAGPATTTAATTSGGASATAASSGSGSAGVSVSPSLSHPEKKCKKRKTLQLVRMLTSGGFLPHLI